ncbi:MAG: DNA-3-methyladenine glycosylase [Candidatus Giovannonibacteria bacterium]|nr:MAG: DNA-3-methyladenine glycosylase [Candidatus Giovannonibacteria bacterium]
MGRKILTQKFFNRAASSVARELLGKFLCRQQLGNPVAKCYMITETEAYDGFKDKASHAHRGKTARNSPMFGPAGRWYVYFTYGMHWMLNIVTGPKEFPAAVLIRGVSGQKELDGPAKLTEFLKIDKRFNNKPAARAAGLWIESASWRSGTKIKKSQIKRAPRIGVNYAGKWAKKPYRFLLAKQ